jgi:nicotinamidase-related amidase
MKACLLVIDYINEITHAKGKAPSCAAFVKDYQVIEKTNAAIEFARKHSMLIIFVKIGFSGNYYEIPSQSPVFSGAPSKDAFKLNEWGTEFNEDLNYKLTDAVIIKPRVSPFYATALEAYLRGQKIDTLIICGVSTNNAVQAAARDAHDRDYRVIILEDACGAKNLQTHENTLALLKDFSEVIKVEELKKKTE